VDRNLGKIRRIGGSTAAIVALGGMFALSEWGDRLGSPQAYDNGYISHAAFDSFKVEVVLVPLALEAAGCEVPPIAVPPPRIARLGRTGALVRRVPVESTV